MTTNPSPLAEPGAPLRRREAQLTPAQLALARDLGSRAERLWTNADGELSLSEAVALAAVQIGYFESANTQTSEV